MADAQQPWRAYPKVSEAIKVAVKLLGGDTASVTREHAYYRFLCMAKHSNPIALRALGVTIGTPDTVSIHIGPYCSVGVIESTLTALSHALQYAFRAQAAFAAWHDPNETKANHMAEIQAIQREIDAWDSTLEERFKQLAASRTNATGAVDRPDSTTR